MAKKRTNANVVLASYDEIFTTEEERQDAKLEKVQQISLSDLYPFKDHPFKVIDDEHMMKTVESIAEYGVLSPAIARPRAEGGYELISGHRRCHASKLAGLETMPVIVREMDDDAATILMVDSNLQRETILPSERAYAYKMKLEAMNRVKGRPKKEGQLVPNYLGKKSTEIIGDETGESGRQVQRFIRLTNLIPTLLDMVDEKKLSFNPAVELSYLKPAEQEAFANAIEYTQSIPSLSQAQRIKRMSQDGGVTLGQMCGILNEEKKSTTDKVTFKQDVLKKYFPKTYTPKQMEDTIIKLLENWQKQKTKSQER